MTHASSVTHDNLDFDLHPALRQLDDVSRQLDVARQERAMFVAALDTVLGEALRQPDGQYLLPAPAMEIVLGTLTRAMGGLWVRCDQKAGVA